MKDNQSFSSHTPIDIDAGLQDPKRVLFLCTGNSCRSQMAEGWCRALYPESIQAFSAGIEAQGINPIARQVMAEAGIDISSQSSTSLERYLDQRFDLVVTVCDHAREHCPVLSGSPTLHHRFEDPPALAATLETEQQRLDCYRQVRDQIHTWMQGLGAYLQDSPQGGFA